MHRILLLPILLLAGCASDGPPASTDDLLRERWPAALTPPAPAAEGVPSPAAPEPSEQAPAGSWTLEHVLARVAAANPDLARAEAHLAAARAAGREADASTWPELSLNLGYLATDEPGQAFGLLLNQRELSLGPGFDPTPGTTENWRKELRLDWALFAPGRGPTREAAREGESAAALAREAVERRLLNAGVQSWLAYLAARELEAVARESVGVVEQRLETTRARVREGAALRADVLRLETRLAAARQAAGAAGLDVRRAASALAALMGAAPDGRASLPQPASSALPVVGLELEGLALEELLERASSERLDLAAAAHQARASALAERARSQQRLPQVGLFAAYDVDGDDPGIDTDLGWSSVGVGVRLPLSRRTGAAIERASAERRAALEALRALSVEVAREVHDAWAAVAVADETLALASSAVEAAEEAYRIVASAQDAGGATVTDVLEAEDARRRARVAVVAARAGAALARARLAAATGGVR